LGHISKIQKKTIEIIIKVSYHYCFQACDDHISHFSAVLEVIEETKDVDKEVDKVKVKADSTHNVFVRGKSLVDDVGIIDDVTTEEEAAQYRKNKIDGTVEGEEDGNQSGHNKCEEKTEKERTHTGEIILGLQSEKGQSQEHTDGNKQCLKDNNVVIEGDGDTEGEGFHNREG